MVTNSGGTRTDSLGSGIANQNVAVGYGISSSEEYVNNLFIFISFKDGKTIQFDVLDNEKKSTTDAKFKAYLIDSKKFVTKLETIIETNQD